MMDFSNYIEKNFSNELKLILLLSQEELNPTDFDKKSKQIDWDIFYKLVIKHRLISHILKHSEYLSNIIPAEFIQKLKQEKIEQSKKALNYTNYLIQIHDLFVENNILHCFFKGPLLSFELYGDVGYRNFGDIDVLVNKVDVERAKGIIEGLRFVCIYPRIKFSERQKNVNYSISHHYHFTNKVIDIELHWSITNPKSFFGIESSEIITNSTTINISNRDIPYISETMNFVFLAAHGSIHQWYRLFWIKDFSVLLSKSGSEKIMNAWEFSKKLKLEKCFWQACQLAHIIYKSEIPDTIELKKNDSYILIPLKSIGINDLKQQGIIGRIKFVFYLLKLKVSWKYYFDLVYRLRTHLTDWEKLKLPDSLFFMYYILRPFLLFFKSKSR